MQKNTTRLDQLTSLRFLAALMLVLHHSIGLFGIKGFGFNLDQGVSFFFVLSGFILTYVYPELRSWSERRQFWRARIARIWPAYLASFALGFVVTPYQWVTETAIANLLMVQAWIPLSTFYFSYNAVSWSVSAEWFFYIVFPLLLYRWNATWVPKLLVSIGALIGLMVVATVLGLPTYGHPGVGQNGLLVTQHGLLFINPLARILEFIVGMCVALAWKKRVGAPSSPAGATGRELFAVLLCVGSMVYMYIAVEWVRGTMFGAAAVQWMVHSGSAPAFAFLIYVMAQGKGAISRLLANRGLVFLGEISYSIYLVHQILLYYYSANIGKFAVMPNAVAFGVFFVVLILVSYLMWVCVEVPGRRLITGRLKVRTWVDPAGGWRAQLADARKPLAAGVVLVAILAVVYSGGDRQGLIRQQDALQLTPDALKKLVGTEFGGLFALRGVDVKCKPDGLHLRLAWERMVDRKLDYTTAVHVTDAKGEILAQLDFKSPVQQRDLRAGDVWVDTVLIAPGKLPPATAGVAVGLYDASVQLLPIDRGPTDWGGRRLVIGVDRCPGP